jgi:hypothetical protein
VEWATACARPRCRDDDAEHFVQLA